MLIDYMVCEVYNEDDELISEGANGVLKVINRTGRGYSFGVIRARILTMQGEPAKTFVCGECKGEYEVRVKARNTAYKGNLCSNCNRIYMMDWFRRHRDSTRKSG